MMIRPFDFGAVEPTLAIAAEIAAAARTTMPMRHAFRLIRSPFVPHQAAHMGHCRCDSTPVERRLQAIAKEAPLPVGRGHVQHFVTSFFVTPDAAEDGDHR